MTLSPSHPTTRALTSPPPPSPAARPSKAPRTRQIPSPPPRRAAQGCPIRPRTGPAPRTPHPAVPYRPPAPLRCLQPGGGRDLGAPRLPPGSSGVWSSESKHTQLVIKFLLIDSQTGKGISHPHILFFFLFKKLFYKIRSDVGQTSLLADIFHMLILSNH